MQERLAAKLTSRTEENFFDSTHLHGFSFIMCSTYKLEVAFWVIVMLIFSGFMVKDLILYHADVKEVPLVTEVNMHYNKSFLIPQLTTCTMFELQTDLLKNMTNDDIDALLAKDIKGYMEEEWYAMPVESIMLFADYFGWLYQIEAARGNVHVSMTDWMTTFPDVMPRRMHLEAKLDEFGLSRVDIHTNLSYALQDHLEMLASADIMVSAGYPAPHGIEIGNITYLTSSEVCFTPTTSPFSLNITNVDKEIMSVWRDLDSPYELRVYLDVPKAPHRPISTQLLTSAQSKRYHNVEIRADGFYTAIPEHKGRTICTETEDAGVCESRCRTNTIRSLCNCRPFTYALFADDVDVSNENICSLAEYGKCLEYHGIVDSECMNACAPPCSIWHWSTRTLEESKGYDEFITMVGLRLKSSIYPEFAQEYKYTTQNIIGDFGGICGAWFGASLMSFLHVLVYLIKLAYEKFSKHKNAVDVEHELPTMSK